MNNQLKVLIIDDEKDYRQTYKMLLESRGFAATCASCVDEALEILNKEYFPLILSDVIMPGMNGLEFLEFVKKNFSNPMEIILVTGYGNVQTAVQAIKNGAFGYFIKNHNPEELLIEIEKAKRIIEMQGKLNSYQELQNNSNFIYQTKNPRMKELIKLVETIAATNSNVLITGESGVGKEVMAKLIHDKSERAKKAFIPVNCQSFSENIIESELFGHEKGSFTGAYEKRIGRFEEANGGTLFLDEVGELSHSTQVKLLRVLESKEIERIGSNKQIPVDFRLICATNKEMSNIIRGSLFREDLYYRINTIEMEIPPLRERKEDIEEMIFFFVNKFKKELRKDIVNIDDRTMAYLVNYQYPGNIRELKNIIERLMVTSQDKTLKLDDLNEKSNCANKKNNQKNFQLKTYKEAKREFEIEYLTNVLAHFNYNITQAASFMQMSRRQLFNKITEYNLKEGSK